ncbi:MAG: DEAD/DEAH box helicase family protein [Alicyclobacillus sp.]|nr:DEAD/DEAH box helicase family protein [Alicyclobacillus sp.]
MNTVLKAFQQEAVNNAVAVLTECLSDLARIRSHPQYEQERQQVIAYKGTLLFEAPTGIGKTLMAGAVVEQLSLNHRILWFWFAPFAGLVEQAARTLRREFSGLRVKDLSADRNAQDLRPGDAFVTTWASVAVSDTNTRNARRKTEHAPTVDALVAYAKAQGFHIGVVIDEAHHGFLKQSQAFSFYKDVLAPDVTILATATPKDSDVEAFRRRNELEHIYRISISRQQGVAARLLKDGVKVAVFKAEDEVRGLIDFQKTALYSGVETHRELKRQLEAANVHMTPLLLVQADSEEGSIETITQWLKDFGFRDEQIRSHTAQEPDPHLLSIAHDETVEVLIFKLAVATGFDAPRAFTLVSMRTARDADFGLQIVGRILRVDRRLQRLPSIPEPLRYGYVFLADQRGQTGLLSAADRINSIRDELSPAAPVISVVAVDPSFEFGLQQPYIYTERDQMILPLREFVPSRRAETDTPASGSGASRPLSVLATDDELSLENLLLGAMGLFDADGSAEKFSLDSGQSVQLHSQTQARYHLYRYRLRDDLDFPKKFKKAVVSLNRGSIVRDIVARFPFDERVLAITQRSATNILMEELEIFERRKETPKLMQAMLAQSEIDRLAQVTLFEADPHGMVDVRDLHNALEQRLREEFSRAGWLHMLDAQSVRDSLHKILALRPDALRKAIDEALYNHIEIIDAEPIPSEIQSATPLAPSRLNVYRVYPDDLNSWERAFAEKLDSDVTGTVKWWHRNPARKTWSVSLPLLGQPNFYPDFVVGVRDRVKGDGILLIETKREINDGRGNAQTKAQAEHPVYKRVMMVYWQNEQRWYVVEYDPITDKNFLSREFRYELLSVY